MLPRLYIRALLNTTLLLMLATPALVAADDYSDGMRAYMQKEYLQAQSYWLKGAEKNDAKSMFNLGFLHEQGLLPEASIAKAESWYRLAGQNGYPAADYHLAQLVRAHKLPIRDPAAADQLIKRAAQQGYAPARREVGKGAITTQDSGRYLDESWIRSQRAAGWTIQLLAFEDLAKVREFIETHGLHERAAYFAERGPRGTLYKLIYGAYESKDQAASARQSLPENLRQHGPWLRTIGSVQKVIAAR